ncbi:MAG: PAS domain-containing sensor histidine kinase [Opitutales bacterium]
MKSLDSNEKGNQQFSLLARMGYFESFLLFGLFGLSLEAAFLMDSGLAGPIALGLGVTIALRARLSGALGVGLLSLILLTLTGVFSGASWAASEYIEAWALVGVTVLFTAFAGLVVSDLQRSQDLQAQGRNMLHKIFDALPIGVWVRARDGGTIFVNERWASFSDRGVEEILAASDSVPPVDLGYGWEEELEAILDSDDGAIRYRSIELREESGRMSSLTLLSLGLYIDPIEEVGTLSLLIDETALRLYEEKVRRSEHSLRLALDSARMGFWDKDLEAGQTVIDANWYRLIGLPCDQAADSGELWQERLHPDERERVTEAYDTLLRSDQVAMRIDYRLRHAKGHYIWVQDSVSVTERTADGRPLRMMGTMQDISERKKTEQDLEFARDRAEAANQAKSQFIAIISHEIRTPLNAIIGMSSFLMEGEEDGEKKEFAETIHNSGRSLLLLLNDILDFSRIEAGRYDLEVQEFPLRLLFDDCVKLFRLRAAEKGLTLKLEIDETIPEYALGDMERLRQILQNLLSNALKFTDEGQVKVVAAWIGQDSLPSEFQPVSGEVIGYLDEPDCEYLKVVVRDTGIGIPRDRQDGLFEAFSQVDTTATRKHGGTGLGLVICKRLVEAMGGEIWLESEPGEGTSVHFFVRTKPASELLEPSPEPTESSGAGQSPIPGPPCKLLIVGEPRSVRPLTLACRKLGYQPDQTDDFKLEHPGFSNRRYNIVFIHMGAGEASWQLVRQIGAQGHTKKPDAIVGVAAADQDISTDHLQLSGLRAVIRDEPEMQALRQLIQQVLEECTGGPG